MNNYNIRLVAFLTILISLTSAIDGGHSATRKKAIIKSSAKQENLKTNEKNESKDEMTLKDERERMEYEKEKNEIY